MGRWTPLVLMAGGLAILLGTLLGISFPMARENAQAPNAREKSSSVLPANINVNSSAAGTGANNTPNSSSNNSSSVAQNSGENASPGASGTPNQQNNPSTVSPANSPQSGSNQQSSEPIPALW